MGILKPKLVGWSNAFAICTDKTGFQIIDTYVYNCLKARIRKVYGKQARGRKANRVYDKLFPRGNVYNHKGKKHKDNWVLAVYQNSQKSWFYLPKASWTLWKRHA